MGGSEAGPTGVVSLRRYGLPPMLLLLLARRSWGPGHGTVLPRPPCLHRSYHPALEAPRVEVYADSVVQRPA
eukprot:5706259-Pyramimonas_sp.AAC.1